MVKELTKADLLAEPFLPEEIEWRVQRSGNANGKQWAMVLAYVTNRAIMERLDAVFGYDGWQNEFKELTDGGILCGISANLNNQWIIKWDGANKTDIEPTKGGISNAMKRAGVQWGIGRYLYNLDTTFVTLVEGRGNGIDQINAVVEKKVYHFDRPKLPNWAMPKQAV